MSSTLTSACYFLLEVKLIVVRFRRILILMSKFLLSEVAFSHQLLVCNVLSGEVLPEGGVLLLMVRKLPFHGRNKGSTP